MFRKLLLAITLVVPAMTVVPAVPAGADPPVCVQTPQKPYFYQSVMWFGTLIQCDKPIEFAYLTGAAYNAANFPLAVASGPATSVGPGPWPLPSPQHLFFWSNPFPCVSPDRYYTAMLAAVLVATDGSMTSLAPQSSGLTSGVVNCTIP